MSRKCEHEFATYHVEAGYPIYDASAPGEWECDDCGATLSECRTCHYRGDRREVTRRPVLETAFDYTTPGLTNGERVSIVPTGRYYAPTCKWCQERADSAADEALVGDYAT